MLGTLVTQDEEGFFNFDSLVIGIDMESLSFAKNNGIPCLFISNDHRYPYFYDSYSMRDYLDLIFDLSSKGMIPFGNLIDNMRLEIEEKKLNIFIGPKKYIIKYNKLFIFCDKGIDGLPQPEEVNYKYRVLDWLDLVIKEGMYDDIKTDSDFVKIVHFYQSKRNKKEGFCDAVAISYMNEKELKDLEWSDTYVRLKTKKLFKEAGIVGTKMGSGRYRPSEVKLSHREIIPLLKNKYLNIEGIEFL